MHPVVQPGAIRAELGIGVEEVEDVDDRLALGAIGQGVARQLTRDRVVVPSA